jgi:hypothetical protein
MHSSQWRGKADCVALLFDTQSQQRSMEHQPNLVPRSRGGL